MDIKKGGGDEKDEVEKEDEKRFLSWIRKKKKSDSEVEEAAGCSYE